MGFDGTTEALEQSSDFPVAVDAEPQLVPEAIVQVLTTMPVDPSLCFSPSLLPGLLWWIFLRKA